MCQQIVVGERVWLDLLPDDVCNRIAGYVSTSGLNSSLGFSKVSDTQCRAVRHSLSFKIELFTLSWYAGAGDEFESLCQDVVSLFGDDVREINEFYLKTWNHVYPQCVKKCFRLPSLRAVCLHSSEKAFDVLDDIVVYAKNLRSLRLEFGCETTEGYMTALQRLSVLNVRQLVIVPQGICFCDLFGTNQGNYSRLASWFPRVEKLGLFCCSNVSRRHASSNIWRCMEPFPALKEVALSEEVPEDAIAKLKAMDRVALSREAVSQLVDKIPDRVVRIQLDGIDEGFLILCKTRFPSYYTDRTLLQRFAGCRSLESLVCCISPGTEIDLFKVMGNLRSLALFAVGDLDPNGPEYTIFVTPYVPISGAMLEAVKSAPYLKRVLLRNIEIERRELGEIFMALGTRLEEFDECMLGRGDFRYHPEDCRRELEEQIAVIEIAMRHNPSLRSFRVDVNAKWFSDKEVVLSLLPQLDKTVELLNRRAPSLHDSGMRNTVCKFSDEVIPAHSSESEHSDAGE